MKIKLPFLDIIYYYINNGMEYPQALSSLISVFGYKIDSSLYGELGLYMGSNKKDVLGRISHITPELIEEAGMIRNGFGSTDIADEILFLASSPAFDFDKMKELLNVAHFIDISGMESAFSLVYDYSGWNIMDWGRYILYLKSEGQTELGEKIMLSRFNSKDYLLSLMGLNSKVDPRDRMVSIINRYEKIIQSTIESDHSAALELTDTYTKMMRVLSTFREDKSSSLLDDILHKISLSKESVEDSDFPRLTDSEFDGIEDTIINKTSDSRGLN